MHYAASVATRVFSNASDPSLTVLAARSGYTQSPAVLIGLRGNSFSVASVHLSVDNLDVLFPVGSSLQVIISRIPNSGEAALANLPVDSTMSVTVATGQTQLSLPSLPVFEALLVIFTASGEGTADVALLQGCLLAIIFIVIIQ